MRGRLVADVNRIGSIYDVMFIQNGEFRHVTVIWISSSASIKICIRSSPDGQRSPHTHTLSDDREKDDQNRTKPHPPMAKSGTERVRVLSCGRIELGDGTVWDAQGLKLTKKLSLADFAEFFVTPESFFTKYSTLLLPKLVVPILF